MATSPIFGWPEPNDTDFVKDGADAMRTLGNAIDSTVGGIDLTVTNLISPFLLMGA
jgi:hypothetical protein